MYYNKRRYYETLLRKITLLEQLYLEGIQDDLRKHLGENTFNMYMDVRKKFPSEKEIDTVMYPYFDENDILNNKEIANKFSKKYSNLRKSNLITVVGGDLWGDYPLDAELENPNQIKKSLNYYNKMKDYAIKKFNDFRQFNTVMTMDPGVVYKFVSDYTSTRDTHQQNKSKGATKLYEDDEWLVYKITSYEAAAEYGKGTKWCITGRLGGHGEDFFNKYIKKDNLDGGYYFYINKKHPSEKYCVLQSKDGEIKSIWDAGDTNRGTSNKNLSIDLPEVNGISLKSTDNRKDLLIKAIERDNGIAVSELLNNGLDPNKVLDNALYFAIQNESCNAVDALLANGADPDYRDAAGDSLISLVCRMANPNVSNKIVRSLLQYAKNIDRETFNDICQYCDHLTIQTVPGLDYKVNGESLKSAIKYIGPGRSKVVELLLKKGADPNITDNRGNTVLFKLLRMDQRNKEVQKIIKILRKHGAVEYLNR